MVSKWLPSPPTVAATTSGCHGVTTPARARGQLKVNSEAELFAFLGLAEVPPELREGLGELDAAETKGLPELVKMSDIRGVFHNHTTASDGRASIEEMAEAAQVLGFDYIGLADHSKASHLLNWQPEVSLEQGLEETVNWPSSKAPKS